MGTDAATAASVAARLQEFDRLRLVDFPI